MRLSLGGWSELVEKEHNAAGEQIVGSFAGIGDEQFQREGIVVRAQNELAAVDLNIAEDEAREVADGVKIGPVGPVRQRRVVMAINERDGIGHDERLHGQGIGRGNTHGDKALPGAPRVGGAGVDRLESIGRKMDERLDGAGADEGLEESHRVGNERNGRV